MFQHVSFHGCVLSSVTELSLYAAGVPVERSSVGIDLSFDSLKRSCSVLGLVHGA